MGMAAALKLYPLLSNLSGILAIELLAAGQALDLLAPLKTGRLAEKARAMLRAVSLPVTHDRSLHKDIARVAQIVSEGAFAGILTPSAARN
jgi:histidine ammonia-lyase